MGVMDGHVAACRNAGPRVCQLVASRRDGDPQDSLHGSLSLRAEPQWLQRFIKGVQSDAVGAAGRVTSQWTTTEDLTREIVDTEATLRAKRALRDRLQQLLATRPGSLSDLLGVERELSRVQSEIDSTESNLTAMRTRVAMSALTIETDRVPAVWRAAPSSRCGSPSTTSSSPSFRARPASSPSWAHCSPGSPSGRWPCRS